MPGQHKLRAEVFGALMMAISPSCARPLLMHRRPGVLQDWDLQLPDELRQDYLTLNVKDWNMTKDRMIGTVKIRYSDIPGYFGDDILEPPPAYWQQVCQLCVVRRSESATVCVCVVCHVCLCVWIRAWVWAGAS